MRIVSGLIVLALVSQSAAACAQSALEGPLAAQGTPAPVAKPPKAKSPTAKAHRAVKHVPSKDTAAMIDPAAAPPAAPSPRTAPPASPVDFGMKWNGSNDSARDTRVQNYDGSAVGTGAEVGMKLHF